MLFRRAAAIAILSAVTLLSHGARSQTSPVQTSGVIVRMDALDAVLSKATPESATRTRAGSRKPAGAPPPIVFIDETTPWIPPPEDPQPSAPDILDATAVLQCVPFARFISGIRLHGDAWTWWDDAAGIYARGNYPEPGAILSFPGIDRMPLGHVAVVKQVLTARKILIDHANWPNAIVQHGAISHDIQVVDVSPGNDWSEVRVQFGEGGPLGSVYPVNGFIYGWSETGVQLAQPRFSLDYALWSPVAPTLRMFNAITYLWALPPAERKKAYAAAGVMPPIAPHPRSELVLGPAGSRPDSNAAQRGLGVIRLDTGLDGRPWYGFDRLVVR